MLGLKSEHKVIKGEVARAILAKMVRVQTGNLSKEDLREKNDVEKSKTIGKYEAKWNF